MKNISLTASAVALAAFFAAPVFAQATTPSNESGSIQSQADSSMGSRSEKTHAHRADQERMMARKQAHAAKMAHNGNHQLKAARHHKMAAADERAAAAAQDKASMSAAPQH